MRSRSANFVIRFKSLVLYKLLQRIAVRAYEMGVEDGKRGVSDTGRVTIDPTIMRKFE